MPMWHKIVSCALAGSLLQAQGKTLEASKKENLEVGQSCGMSICNH